MQNTIQSKLGSKIEAHQQLVQISIHYAGIISQKSVYFLRAHRKLTVLTAKIYKEISSHLIEISHSSFDQNSVQTKREISVILSVWSEALQNVNMPRIIVPKNEQSVCQYTRNS